MVSNPNKYSEMGTGTSLNDIRDDDDFPHVGLIKALADGIGQNYAINGFNASSISATSVVIAAGNILRDGKLFPVNGATLTIAAAASGTGNTYSLLVCPTGGSVGSPPTVTRRQGTVKGKTPAITAGDTIIGILVHTGSSPMQIQYLTVNKPENNVSIGYSNSGTFAQVGTLEGLAGGTTLDSTVGALTLTSANDVTVKLGGIATSDVFSVTDSDDQVQLSVNANGAVTLVSGGSITIGSASLNETELEIIDGATLSTTELNTLDGVAATLTATELNYVDGVTSAIQTQLDAKVKQGKHTMWIPSSAMTPLTTNGCSDLTLVEMTATRPELQVLDFAADAPDYAQFTVAFPKSWNEGTVTFQPFWTVTGTDGGGVNWTLTGISIADNGIINSGYPSAATQASKAHSGTSNDLNVSVESGTLTITNAAVDTVTYFKIARNTADGGDDQTGVARLIGIKMFYTTDAENDA
tara:strand:- start:656 stop:2059 length:1404 start_codon:yes stop_codon:yes gene_type:complete